jgi:serine protease Do
MSPMGSASGGRDALHPLDQAVVLVNPGVVSVDTSVSVSIQVTDQEPAQAVGLPALQGSYALRSMSGGSGMVVAPDWVVTAGHVVRPHEQQRRRIISYAVNRLFFQSDAGGSLGENADLFDQHRTGDPALDELLRRCYDEVACRFEIEPTVTIFTPAQIASGSTTEGLAARALGHFHFDGGDIAALQLIDADPLPTVPLASSTAHVATGDVVTALGYLGSVQELPIGLLEPIKVVGRINIRSEGPRTFYETSASLTPGMSGGPTVNLQGEIIGLASFKNEYDACDHHHLRLLTVDDIRLFVMKRGAVCC